MLETFGSVTSNFLMMEFPMGEWDPIYFTGLLFPKANNLVVMPWTSLAADDTAAAE